MQMQIILLQKSTDLDLQFANAGHIRAQQDKGRVIMHSEFNDAHDGFNMSLNFCRRIYGPKQFSSSSEIM